MGEAQSHPFLGPHPQLMMSLLEKSLLTVGRITIGKITIGKKNRYCFGIILFGNTAVQAELRDC
jgi:hypothetical protein